MDRVIEWGGTNECQLCNNKVVSKIYDARVSTYRGTTWANVCEACYNAYGVGKTEPFVWDNSYNNFIKVKHVHDEAMFLADNLGIEIDEAEMLCEDFGL